MLVRRWFAAAALLSLAVLPAASAGERPWLEVRSPHFTVASNADEKTARRVAFEYEQIAVLIPTLWPWAQTRSGRPFFVLAVQDEEGMKDLAPAYWESKGGSRPGNVFEAVADRSYVALRTDLTQSPVYRSYVSVVLTRSFGRELPPWFRVGLSELFSNPEIHEKELRLGAVIPRYLNRLRERGTIDLSKLLAVERTSPYYREAETRAIFDAESWALAHYLFFGERGTLLPKLNRYATLLKAKKGPNVAMTEAFGNLAQLETGLRNYLRLFTFAFQSFDVGSGPKEAEIVSRPLPVAESAAMRAAFHVASGRPAEARARLAEAKRADASCAIIYEVEGLLADREGRTEDARAAYTRAVELGGASYYALYRYARDLRRPGADADTLARIATTLERVIALSPDYANAHSYQAEILDAQGHAQQAEGSARRAVTLAPDASHHRLTLARVLWDLSRSDEARQEAEKGMALAVSAADIRAAQGLLDDLGRASLPATPKTAADGGLPGSCRAGDEAACGKLAPGYQEDCNLGERQACLSLAKLQAQGLGVPKDEAAAQATSEKLCADGMPEACTQLAALLEGTPSEEAHTRARELLKNACHGGYEPACEGLKATPIR